MVRVIDYHDSHHRQEIIEQSAHRIHPEPRLDEGSRFYTDIARCHQRRTSLDQFTPYRFGLSMHFVIRVQYSVESRGVNKNLITSRMLHRQRRESRRGGGRHRYVPIETARLRRSHAVPESCGPPAPSESGHCPHRCGPMRKSTICVGRQPLAICVAGAPSTELESESLPT